MRSLFWVTALSLLIACGPSSKRDPSVSGVHTTYDDGCDLQAYFDQRAGTTLPSPAPLSETVREDEQGRTIGEGDYELRDPHARARLARMLREEFADVPPLLIAAVEHADKGISVRLAWWDSGGIRRVRMTRQIKLRTPKGNVELPANVCVGDLIFGAKVYAMRARYVRTEIALAIDDLSAPPAPSVSASASGSPSE